MVVVKNCRRYFESRHKNWQEEEEEVEEGKGRPEISTRVLRILLIYFFSSGFEFVKSNDRESRNWFHSIHSIWMQEENKMVKDDRLEYLSRHYSSVQSIPHTFISSKFLSSMLRHSLKPVSRSSIWITKIQSLPLKQSVTRCLNRVLLSRWELIMTFRQWNR